MARAQALVREARAGRPGAATEAARVLETGTGRSQPELLGELRQTPPDLAGAENRLAAIAAAMAAGGAVADPEAARRDLHATLAQPRFDSLRRGESFWDRIWGWIAGVILPWLATAGFGSLPAWAWLALVGAVAVVSLAVALGIVRASWTRTPGGDPGRIHQASPPIDVVDHFRLADAAAGLGDHTTAVRHLVAAVATAVSGRPTWNSSPLTVREIFRRAGRLEELESLVAEFERAVYGARLIDTAGYERLARLAAPFRPTSEAAAA